MTTYFDLLVLGLKILCLCLNKAFKPQWINHDILRITLLYYRSTKDPIFRALELKINIYENVQEIAS